MHWPYRWIATFLFLALLNACATTPRVLLDTGQGAPLEHIPPRSSQSVEVSENEFEQALPKLVLEAPLTLRPPHQGWLVLTSASGSDTEARQRSLMRKSFGGMCRPGQPKEDCLSLLDDIMGMSPTDKLVVALGLSFDPMRESIARAMEQTLTPQFFATAIVVGMVTWAILAANPEPIFTKAAAIVSAVMMIYLGVDAFLAMVKACFELKRSTDQAVTFAELKEASARFGRVMGEQGSRVFILAVTLLVSRGTLGSASWLAARLPLLPSFAEASAVGATQIGIRLEQVGQVSAVAVVEGKLAITLAPTALAMIAGGDGSSRTGGTEPSASSTNYRETFFAAYPALRDKVFVHHAIEQQVLKKYPGLFTEAEVHSLKNLRGIPRSINSEVHLGKIRRAWNEFYRSHPKPTRQDVLDFANRLDKEFGALFEPPL
jgi:hypothetical protein